MLNESPVTVVVPIYNVEKFLDRCINSIVSQTYSEIKLVFVDDGSPDECARMCDEWAARDSRIRVIHKKNAGLGMARNSGLDITAGDYVFFIDSDDYLDAKTVESCVKRAEEDDSDLVKYGMVIEDLNGIVSTRIPCVEKDFYCGTEIMDYFLPAAIASDSITGKQTALGMSSCCLMYSMRVINEAHWRYVSEREIISEDYYSLLDLFAFVSRVSVIKEGFYHYWVNTNSLSRSYKKDRYSKICDCHKAMVKLAEGRGYPEKVISAIHSQIFGSIIGALKMIMYSNLSFSGTMTEYNWILKDEYFKSYIKNVDADKEPLPRRILLWNMRWGFTGIVYLIIRLHGHG